MPLCLHLHIYSTTQLYKYSVKSQFRVHPQRFMYLHIQKRTDFADPLRRHTFILKEIEQVVTVTCHILSYIFQLCPGAPCGDIYRYCKFPRIENFKAMEKISQAKMYK